MDRLRFQTSIGLLVSILCMLNAAILGGVIENHRHIKHLEAKLKIVASEAGVHP